MWLLVGGVTKVEAPPWEAFQELVFASSFCGCGSAYLEPPTMGIVVALSSVAAAIPSLALVANDGLFESPRPPPSIGMVGC